MPRRRRQRSGFASSLGDFDVAEFRAYGARNDPGDVVRDVVYRDDFDRQTHRTMQLMFPGNYVRVDEDDDYDDEDDNAGRAQARPQRRTNGKNTAAAVPPPSQQQQQQQPQQEQAVREVSDAEIREARRAWLARQTGSKLRAEEDARAKAQLAAAGALHPPPTQNARGAGGAGSEDDDGGDSDPFACAVRTQQARMSLQDMRQLSAQPSSAPPAASRPQQPLNPDALGLIMSMGFFDADEVEHALLTAGGHVPSAIAILVGDNDD